MSDRPIDPFTIWAFPCVIAVLNELRLFGYISQVFINVLTTIYMLKITVAP